VERGHRHHQAGLTVRVTVSFRDGRTLEAEVLPYARIQAERKFDMDAEGATKLEQVYYVAWAALGQTGTESRDFNAFLLDLKDVIVVPDTGDEQVPTVSPPSVGE
jgi:hypothetical protein